MPGTDGAPAKWSSLLDKTMDDDESKICHLTFDQATSKTRKNFIIVLWFSLYLDKFDVLT